MNNLAERNDSASMVIGVGKRGGEVVAHLKETAPADVEFAFVNTPEEAGRLMERAMKCAILIAPVPEGSESISSILDRASSKSIPLLLVALPPRLEDTPETHTFQAYVAEISPHMSVTLLSEEDPAAAARALEALARLAALAWGDGPSCLGFDDLCGVLHQKELGFVGIGRAAGEDEAVRAMFDALAHPVYRSFHPDVSGIIFHNAAQADQSASVLDDMARAVKLLERMSEANAPFAFGLSLEDSAEHEVIIIAAADHPFFME